MFFKIIFLKKFANFTGKHLSRSLSNKVAGPHNCNVIKKKLQHKFFPVNFVNYSRPPILWRIYERLVLKHQCNFLKNLFYRTPFLHLQWLFQLFQAVWLFLTVLDFQAATLLKKRLVQRCLYVNFVLKTSFDRTPLDDCFLVFI